MYRQFVHPSLSRTQSTRLTFAIEQFGRHEKRAGRGGARHPGSPLSTTAEQVVQHYSRRPVDRSQTRDAPLPSSDAARIPFRCFSARLGEDFPVQLQALRGSGPKHKRHNLRYPTERRYYSHRSRLREKYKPALCSPYPERRPGPIRNDQFQKPALQRSAHHNRILTRILYVIASWFTSPPDTGSNLR